MIEESEIEAIRSSANIVDIISDYLPLTQKGKNYFGICPFHDDNSPSMSVSFEKQIYKCFACGASGNVFTFVQNYENVSFVESIKIVAQKIGYPLFIQTTKSIRKNELDYQIMDIAAKFFRNNLNTKAGAAARAYLNKRQITEQSITDFEIGYALPDRNSLAKLLMGKGYQIEKLLKLGLINQDGTNIYDVFNNRIIFPIHDENGEIVGFTGRIFQAEDLAKYYNSKESEIFKKGNILYNFHRAKSSMKTNHELILVEGNMDVIRMDSYGFKNTIALMGTSLTTNQVEQIKKARSKVILMFDADSAGELATINNGQILENNKIDSFVVRLEGFKDPDEYLNHNGVENMQKLLENKMGFLDYKLFYYSQNKNLNQPSELLKFIQEIIKSLEHNPNQLAREITLKKISSEYDLPLDVLKAELKTIPPSKAVHPVIKKQKTKYEKACELLIYFLINNESYLKKYQRSNLFINHKEYRAIINDIISYEMKFKTIGPAQFISYVSQNNEFKDLVLQILAQKLDYLDEDTFDQCLTTIESLNQKIKINQIKAELKTTLDINQKIKLANQIIELKKGSDESERN